MYRFARNGRSSIAKEALTTGPSTKTELDKAEVHWTKVTQHVNFTVEIATL